MTPRERLLAAITGRVVDRVPLWTHIPFRVAPTGFVPGPFHGYSDGDDWRPRDPAYWRLVQRMEREGDSLYLWRPPCMDDDPLLVPPSATRISTTCDEQGRRHTVATTTLGRVTLRRVTMTQPGTGHSWALAHPCQTPADALPLLDRPYEGPPPAASDFAPTAAWLGERGLMCINLPSPLLVVNRLFDPLEFLVMVRTERALIRRLMDLAAARITANLDALLATGIGPLWRFGGAELATPPMVAPADFDELVVRYDTPLIAAIKRRGGLVAVHCHGRLRHALPRFAAMGVDVTDPVETRPDGDVTAAEARQLADDRVTLAGNLQVRELAALPPAAIGERVRRLIAEVGPRRLIVTATGTPLEAIPPGLEANYHAMMDAVLAP